MRAGISRRSVVANRTKWPVPERIPRRYSRAGLKEVSNLIIHLRSKTLGDDGTIKGVREVKAEKIDIAGLRNRRHETHRPPIVVDPEGIIVADAFESPSNLLLCLLDKSVLFRVFVSNVLFLFVLRKGGS